MRVRLLLLVILVVGLWAARPTQEADAALYGRAGVLNKGVVGRAISVCFVGDALTSQTSRVTQILDYIKRFEWAANIHFNYLGTCPSPTRQTNGDDYYEGHIRVLIPGVKNPSTGMSIGNVSPVPGKGCTDKGSPNSSWSNFPSDLENHRPCLYNMFLGNDAPPGGQPYLNHTLHEFGHALGLAHEHERFDVDRECAIKYLRQIPDLTYAQANAIFNADYRNVADVARAEISDLQKISGFELYAQALDLSRRARSLARPALYGGQTKAGWLTPYDPRSVMHYKFDKCGINGNYDDTGLSAYDRLGLHILYPENDLVAEFIGRTVLRTTDRVQLQSVWKTRGATMAVVSQGWKWRVDGTTRSTTAELDIPPLAAGVHSLHISFQDKLGLDHDYTYSGKLRVLTPTAYTQQIAGPIAARTALMVR